MLSFRLRVRHGLGSERVQVFQLEDAATGSRRREEFR